MIFAGLLISDRHHPFDETCTAKGRVLLVDAYDNFPPYNNKLQGLVCVLISGETESGVAIG